MADEKKPNFDVELNISASFPNPSFSQWTEIATKSMRGRSLEELLTDTYEGVEIDPLYVSPGGAEKPNRGSCIQQVRPRRGAGKSSRSWQVCELCNEAEIERATEALKTAGSRGVDAIWLRLDGTLRQGVDLACDQRLDARTDGLLVTSTDELDEFVEALATAPAHVLLDAGNNTLWWLAALTAAARRKGLDLGDLKGAIGWDPLGILAAQGELFPGVERSFSMIPELVAWTRYHCRGLRAISVSTLPYHEAGATAVQELAICLATGVEYLRTLAAAGLDPSESNNHLGFTVGVGRDLFMEIAKLRALRVLWARVLEATTGECTHPGVPIHAVTSPRAMSRYDRWVNLLRTTVGAFAAAVGGADVITALPPSLALDLDDETGRRAASNTHSILREEGQLFRVDDPAGGSWYIEHLTDQITQSAWALFQKIESKNGMKSCLLDGTIQSWLSETLDQKTRDVAVRAAPITGVTIFPNLEEKLASGDDRSHEHRARAIARSDVQRATGDASLELARLRSAVEKCNGDGSVFDPAVEAAAAGSTPDQFVAALAGASDTRLETLLRQEREGEIFEVLRDASYDWAQQTGHRPRVCVLALGDPADHRLRVIFTENLMAAGGIETVVETTTTDPKKIDEPTAQHESNVVVICSSDVLLKAEAPKLAQSLKQGGADLVLVTTSPGPDETIWKEKGVGGFIHAGCDVHRLLREVLVVLGVVS